MKTEAPYPQKRDWNPVKAPLQSLCIIELAFLISPGGVGSFGYFVYFISRAALKTTWLLCAPLKLGLFKMSSSFI